MLDKFKVVLKSDVVVLLFLQGPVLELC